MRGLTFVELMATLLIVAVVAAIALPGFSDLVRRGRATAQADLLLKSFNYARGEAVRRNVPVYVTSLNGDANWGVKGWHVWVDKDGNNTFSDGDEELQTQSGLTGNTTLIGPEGLDQLIFAGNGFLQKQAGYTFATALVFSFRVADHCDMGRDITVMYAGRSNITSVTCN
jgi:type IV fimbrial biogenesis protein FimT